MLRKLLNRELLLGMGVGGIILSLLYFAIERVVETNPQIGDGVIFFPLLLLYNDSQWLILSSGVGFVSIWILYLVWANHLAINRNNVFRFLTAIMWIMTFGICIFTLIPRLFSITTTLAQIDQIGWNDHTFRLVREDIEDYEAPSRQFRVYMCDQSGWICRYIQQVSFQPTYIGNAERDDDAQFITDEHVLFVEIDGGEYREQVVTSP